MAARLRIIERSGSSSGKGELDLIMHIVSVARQLHDMLDAGMGAESHSLASSARKAQRVRIIDGRLAKKAMRINTLANRGTSKRIRCYVRANMFSMPRRMAASLMQGATIRKEATKPSTESEVDIARHALPLAEIAVCGVVDLECGAQAGRS